MAKPNPAARENVVNAARTLMSAKGYTATTVDDICDAAGVTKGTFFHYFASKEEIAGAALQSYCEAQKATIRNAPFFKNGNPLERFSGFINFVTASTSDPVAQGCLAGVFAQELSDTHPELRRLCVGAFAQLRSEILELLSAIKAVHAPSSPHDPADLADHFLAVFEGAMVVARAHGDNAPLAASLRHYEQYIRTLFATPPAHVPRAAARTARKRPAATSRQT
ncbi:MAG TPA: TetR/AcrR family transcriptional regulator, partial [Vicinamibacterales bacterium]|nr:TetR/AcrR family transcriptional regulator [Vicinamibacterales bacterium]